MREAFQVEGLTVMIRATRSRSMEGWSRPNHMPSRLDALQTTIPVAFRRLARHSHSVAKQASLSVAFRSDFKGIWSDIRTLWSAKMDAKTDFRVIFFDVFLQMHFAWILG